MDGFFDIGNINTPVQKKLGCSGCDLRGKTQTPDSPVWGKGGRGIMVVLETPTKSEDESGEPLSGQSGEFLKDCFRKIGIDLKRDCWVTYAIRCHTGKIADTQIKSCNTKLMQDISRLNPRIIIPLGIFAVRAVIGLRMTGRLTGVKNEQFFGERIPDQDLKKWICPSFSHKYIMDRDKDIVSYQIFIKHLERAFNCPEFPEYSEPVLKLTTDEKTALEYLDYIRQYSKLISFDYETTGIKPHRKEHEIISISVCDGKNTWAFPYFNSKEFRNAWSVILDKREIGKIAHQASFEDMWSTIKHETKINGWFWDTQLAAHCIDNKQATGLKYHTYVKLGIVGYDSDVDNYIKKSLPGEEKRGDNGRNCIKQAKMSDVLKYNALDSHYTFLLYRQQRREMNNHVKIGFEFFMEAMPVLVEIQNNGFTINMERMQKHENLLTRKMEIQKQKISEFPELKGQDVNIDSNQQLEKLLYSVLGYKKPGAGPLTDEKQLERIGTDFCKVILEYRKIKKLRDTYLAQFSREIYEGKIYPFFGIGRVDTFRSSSNSPNFQNIPKRDPEANRYIRSLVIPSPGNKLVEYDYKGVEVAVSACYHKDRNMIKYITDPTNDMHRDTASDIFIVDREKVTKHQRFCGKNGFVFPAFYGSNSFNIAPNLWEMMDEESREHLKTKGVKTLHQFTKHIEKVEEVFWSERFGEYQQWKWEIWKDYKKNHIIRSYTGFEYQPVMSFNQVTNYPIQGSAFHCLLWSLIQINKEIEKRGFKSKIIGQIHDAMVWDMEPAEEKEIDKIVWGISTSKIIKHFPWIIVPLILEKEVSEIDGNWANMKGSEIFF